MTLFKRFLLIWFIGTVSSAIPFMHIGVVLGAPAVLISAVLVTLIFNKELK